MSRVYIGKLPYEARERDVEDFFRKHGRIRDVVLKNGFGFVEFDDDRDADDAVHELNGAKMMGDRVIVEHCHRESRGGDRGGDRGGGGFRGRGGFRGDFGGDRGGGRFGGNQNSRYGPPTQTSHRLIVENLSTRISWQDLKDYFRGKGCEVTYADAHKLRKNEGLMCFVTQRDLKKALERDGDELNGRKIKLIEDSRRSKSRSRSRSRSRGAKRSRSRSGSRSASRSRSRSKSRSRSASPDDKKKARSASRSRSKSGSASPALNGTKNGDANDD